MRKKYQVRSDSEHGRAGLFLSSASDIEFVFRRVFWVWGQIARRSKVKKMHAKVYGDVLVFLVFWGFDFQAGQKKKFMVKYV